jgi:hypothetical protein
VLHFFLLTLVHSIREIDFYLMFQFSLRRCPGRISVRALSCAVIACAKANQWEEALNLIELYGNESYSYAESKTKNQRSAVVSIAGINSVIGACGRSRFKY